MTSFTTDANRWQAVKDRLKEADGVFFYGVRTTGIYCVPSCPSRAKKQENVEFFNSTLEAEDAGFRPCKRCTPKSKGSHPHLLRVINACETIAAAEEAPPLLELAEESGLSQHHFHKVFKELTGLTPKAYASALKAGKLRELLSGDTTITNAIYEAGYGASSRFYEQATNRLGMNPKIFQQGGQGTAIRFAVGICSLGAVLVGATQKGVCAIDIGKHARDLIKDFQDRFHSAKLIAGDRDFEQLVATVIGMIDNPNDPVDLPLDIKGTVFQEKVWIALRKIPAGKTMTYSELAEAIGKPKAVRAVASACAANKIAVAIPCHRIIRTDGSLSGYRWGIERKEALLHREKSVS